MLTVYQYAKCSTCRKALKWLDAQGLPYTSIDITTEPPSVKVLRQIMTTANVPLKKLFNTSGQVYRQEGYAEQLKTLSEAEALAALAACGKLIKRPLLIAEKCALVGFKEAEYAAALT